MAQKLGAWFQPGPIMPDSAGLVRAENKMKCGSRPQDASTASPVWKEYRDEPSFMKVRYEIHHRFAMKMAERPSSPEMSFRFISHYDRWGCTVEQETHE